MEHKSSARCYEFVAKNVAKMIANRNDRIVKALNKNGVTEIPEFNLLHGSNGFEGAFKVAGYWVTINTILAGGYNIQCLHQRTLVKVKWSNPIPQRAPAIKLAEPFGVGVNLNFTLRWK